jgi:hypothetical protein
LPKAEKVSRRSAKPCALDSKRVISGHVKRKKQSNGLGDDFVFFQSCLNGTAGVIQAIVKGIRCPMLLIFARDGLFRRFALPRLTPFTFPNLMVTATLHGALSIVSAACRLVGINALDSIHYKVKIAFNFNLRYCVSGGKRPPPLFLVEFPPLLHAPSPMQYQGKSNAQCVKVDDTPQSPLEGGSAHKPPRR